MSVILFSLIIVFGGKSRYLGSQSLSFLPGLLRYEEKYALKEEKQVIIHDRRINLPVLCYRNLICIEFKI